MLSRQSDKCYVIADWEKFEILIHRTQNLVEKKNETQNKRRQI